jgi:3-methyladenine DNA glycosylase AlkD
VAFNAVAAATDLEAQLKAVGTPARAEGEKRYLKSELEHLGVTVWENRRIVKAFAMDQQELSHAHLLELVDALWSRPVFDCRLTVALLLKSYSDHLDPADLPRIQTLIRDSHTWALVDLLAGDVLADVLANHPNAAAEIDPWAEDPDFWVRRAALLSNLGDARAGRTVERFFSYADSMLGEREFFIRKAIGWVLREAGKRQPDAVYDWLAPRIERASGVTVREAVKYLQPERRERLLARYNRGRKR